MKKKTTHGGDRRAQAAANGKRVGPKRRTLRVRHLDGSEFTAAEQAKLERRMNAFGLTIHAPERQTK